MTWPRVASWNLPASESQPNDAVVVGGSAYVTDTARPMVWRLPVGPDSV
jgi:hypothetical protein